ncbi:uncharacterized protein EAE97_005197 [Botrytis byssoidea]|uniref:Uncharacterized protein n=1 Tax=Botrytis byssoidea TaxID=139641 RepID=A0A9P5LV08_9HELO|nr:uncharacterized protein EAE97_005197 [Botrytis byssoidea]KAF7944564.1 hypothetical protein EAE97_005197 [Botrytis byssoidea]
MVRINRWGAECGRVHMGGEGILGSGVFLWEEWVNEETSSSYPHFAKVGFSGDN